MLSVPLDAFLRLDMADWQDAGHGGKRRDRRTEIHPIFGQTTVGEPDEGLL
jgi:hypothetical protein